jgi:cytochrome c-type biogenesis protein CcmH
MLFVTLAMRPAGALQTAPAHAQQPVSTSSPGEVLQYDEKEAQRIDRMLMCPVCPAETIDQAQVEYSKQMRRVVREMLVQGNSRDEILDFFAERYGPQVLAAPPKSGLSLLAWIVPVVAVFAVIAGGLLVIRSMAKRDDAATGEELPAEEGLEEYLAIVDEETSG